MTIGGKVRFLIKNVNVVDVEKGRVFHDVDILIDQDRIIEMGIVPDSSTNIIVEANDLWAIPSLVDMHAHVVFQGRSHMMGTHSKVEENSDLILQGAQNLMEALSSGVCLLRDAGDKKGVSLQLRQLVDEGSIVGPALILSGQPLCCPGGHGSDFGTQISKGEDFRSLMMNHKSSGYEWLKVMNGPELHDEEDLVKMVNWAHKFDLKVMCHAFTEDGIRAAICSGVDTIEHGLSFDEETLTNARQKGIVFVPTCYSAWVSIKPEYLKTIPDIEKEHLKKWYEFLQARFAYNISGQVTMVSGTDGGAAPSTFSDIISEIKMLCYHGMQPKDAIKCSTIIPAQVLGKANDFGSIAKGKLANIILLSKDPTLQIDALDTIVAIYYRGARIIHKELTLGIKSSHTRTLGIN